MANGENGRDVPDGGSGVRQNVERMDVVGKRISRRSTRAASKLRAAAAELRRAAAR
jgi:hypothetical protein